MNLIPLEATPAQEFNIQLDGQACKIAIYQRDKYLYLDLYKDSEPIFRGIRCLTDTLANPFQRYNFNGYLSFTDLQGLCGTPNWEELGTRYLLTYVTEAEMQAGFE